MVYRRFVRSLDTLLWKSAFKPWGEDLYIYLSIYQINLFDVCNNNDNNRKNLSQYFSLIKYDPSNLMIHESRQNYSTDRPSVSKLNIIKKQKEKKKKEKQDRECVKMKNKNLPWSMLSASLSVLLGSKRCWYWKTGDSFFLCRL